jgi:hypothetical protein
MRMQKCLSLAHLHLTTESRLGFCFPVHAGRCRLNYPCRRLTANQARYPRTLDRCS